MQHFTLLFLSAALLVLAGCQTTTKPEVATKPAATATTPLPHNAANRMSVRPAVSAASVPSLPVTTVLLNSWGSAPICNALDESDRMRDAQAERRACAAPIGQKVTWNNPDTGASGTVVAIRDGYDASGAYCRDFVQTLTVKGQTQQRQSKACQRSDGSWAAGS